jgi:hypothetical protein
MKRRKVILPELLGLKQTGLMQSGQSIISLEIPEVMCLYFLFQNATGKLDSRPL